MTSNNMPWQRCAFRVNRVAVHRVLRLAAARHDIGVAAIAVAVPGHFAFMQRSSDTLRKADAARRQSAEIHAA